MNRLLRARKVQLLFFHFKKNVASFKMKSRIPTIYGLKDSLDLAWNTYKITKSNKLALERWSIIKYMSFEFTLNMNCSVYIEDNCFFP